MRTRIRVLLGVVFVVALGWGVGCYSDTTAPRYVPPQPDTTQTDTMKHPG
jgi:hypothetical protein